MKKYRYVALLIGTFFGVIFLAFATGDPQSFRRATPYEWALLVCGPVSLVVATAVGWIAERAARFVAWWLLVAGAASTVLFAVDALPDISSAMLRRIATLLVLLVVYALPMFLTGGLLLKYANSGPSAAARKQENLCPFTYRRDLHEN